MKGGSITRGLFALVSALAGLHLHDRSGAAAEPSSASSSYADRWIYCSFNLQVDHSVDDLTSLFDRARRSGYTGVVLADYKFQVLYRVLDFYFRNVEKVKVAAARAGIELIPAVFSIGYSNGILAQDPNLAEGLEVVDQPYVVTSRVDQSAGKGNTALSRAGRLEAVLDSRPAVKLRNGGLEEIKVGDQFAGFSFQDDPGAGTFADRSVFHSGSISCRLEPSSTAKEHTAVNLRLIQSVAVRPHTAYRFSCWVKTRDLTAAGSFHLLALGAGQGGRQLTFHEGGLERTQDWKRIDVVFNSLDHREVNVYAGIWGPSKGTLWLDDLALEELALVNVLRRGVPILGQVGRRQDNLRGRPRLRQTRRPQARAGPLGG